MNDLTVEELIDALIDSRTTLLTPLELHAIEDIRQAMQTQAERIAELEKQQVERLLRIEAGVDALVAERDTLRAQLVESISNHEACKSANTMLLDEIAAIAATEPVAYRWVWKSKPHDIEGWCYTSTPPNSPELQEIEKLFTCPMPAHDVTELVELTDAQILTLWEETYVQRGWTGIEFARAIERAHGIGVKQ